MGWYIEQLLGNLCLESPCASLPPGEAFSEPLAEMGAHPFAIILGTHLPASTSLPYGSSICAYFCMTVKTKEESATSDLFLPPQGLAKEVLGDFF